jgi:hypothetical protein
MRGYMELVDFMGDVSEGIQDHLPEDQRCCQRSLDDIVESWVGGKKYWAIKSLEKDLESYGKKHSAGDYSVDEILSYYDLLFIWDRFGCEEVEWLNQVLAMIRRVVRDKKRSYFNDARLWIGGKLSFMHPPS